MIEVNETVREFIDLLDTYAQDGLRERTHLGQLLQLAYDTSNTELVGEMAFHGKYLWKLYGTLRGESPDSEHYEKLEQEFSRTIHEFHAKLSLLISRAPEDFQQMMKKHYLDVSENALKNLLSIARDFYWLKNWELEMAQREKGGTGPSSDE